MQIKRSGAVALLALCLLGVLGFVWPHSGNDMIFFGGPILTVNASNEVVEALAVRDGIIVAVGSLDEVMGVRSADTQLVDLQGRALMPGFVAAHEHPTLTAVFNGAH